MKSEGRGKKPEQDLRCIPFIAVLKRGEVCPMPYAQFPMPNALCPMPNSRCPIWPMPYLADALCLMPDSTWCYWERLYFYTICSSKVHGPAHPTNNLRTYETGTWLGPAQALTHDLNQSGALTSWESRLTTKLKPARRTYKNCVLFVGKLSNFLGNSSN
jgi:hypothetical protein